MNLKYNEKLVLKLMLGDSEISNQKIAKKLKLTQQAVGKIKKQLFEKGFIKSRELSIDYEKFGVNLHAIALIKVNSNSLKKQKVQSLINKVLKPINAIRSYSIPQTDVTHVIIYAFKNIKDYDDYFKKIKKTFGDLVEIKESYVFSSASILKSSSKDLFLSVIKDGGKKSEKV